jgi:hypothetical protein
MLLLTMPPNQTSVYGPAEELTRLADRLDEMDVDQLAHIAAIWAQQFGPELNRRPILVKISTALAVAASNPTLAMANSGYPDRFLRVPRASFDVSGIWRSRYIYYSGGRGQQFEGEHYVVLRQDGSRVEGQSLPHSMDSILRLQLSINGHVATGTWTERTSPAGYYKGATYHGTVQLLIDSVGRGMSGKWLGFGQNFRINTGEWKLACVEDSARKTAQRRYHHKA